MKKVFLSICVLLFGLFCNAQIVTIPKPSPPKVEKAKQPTKPTKKKKEDPIQYPEEPQSTISNNSNKGPISIGEVKIGVRHNVIVNQKKGMRIYPAFEVSNAKEIELSVNAYFYFSSGQVLKDNDGEFCTTDGNVSVGKTITPCCVTTIYNSNDPYDAYRTNVTLDVLDIFIPYDELHLAKNRNHQLKFLVQIFNQNNNVAASGWVYFDVKK
jgi:hypothetical protein